MEPPTKRSAVRAAGSRSAQLRLSQLRGELTEQMALLELLKETSAIAAGPQPMRAVLEQVLGRLCERTDSPAALGWVRVDGQMFVTRWPARSNSALRQLVWLPSVRSLADDLVESGLWLDDLAAAAAEQGLELPSRRAGLGALVVPVNVGDRRAGAVAIAIAGGRPHQAVIEALASVAAPLGRVVERDQANKRIFAAVGEEQRRIATALHDGLGQHLAGMALLCKSLLDSLPSEAAQGRELATELLEHLKMAHRDVRHIAKQMFSVGVSHPEALVPALSELARDTQETHGIACSFKTRGALVTFGAVYAHQLYQIAREAVTNALRHGAPREVTIELGNTAGRLVLEIRDDGRGLGKSTSPGVGLFIMRHRAELLGGELTLEPGPAGGTVVRFEAPWPGQAAE